MKQEVSTALTGSDIGELHGDASVKGRPIFKAIKYNPTNIIREKLCAF
jgi:hypothetical protein